jgi:hypothetical protein
VEVLTEGCSPNCTATEARKISTALDDGPTPWTLSTMCRHFVDPSREPCLWNQGRRCVYIVMISQWKVRNGRGREEKGREGKGREEEPRSKHETENMKLVEKIMAGGAVGVMAVAKLGPKTSRRSQ